MRRRRRRSQRFIANQSQRWMISYADFLTLLFAFFVFLYAISSVDSGKFEAVSRNLLQIFDVEPTSIEPIELDSTPAGPDFFNPLFRPEPIPSTREDLADTERYHQESTLLELRQTVEDAFQQRLDDQLISVSGNSEWLAINLQEPILFSPGSADITAQAEAILYEIAALLAPLQQPVAVEGYTDRSAPGGDFDNNWALSVMRAANVVRYLQTAGIAGERLSAVGFGEFQPLFDETNPARAARNRRVSIVVTRLDGSNRLVSPDSAPVGPEVAEP